jgi:hypothetical protein
MTLGQAANAMWCDVSADIRPEFDDWHSHEHFPERLSIPGFLRGTRWVAADGGEGIFTCYEAASPATLTAGPYMERLNNPTPWSRRMMPHHRHMVRALCRVEASFGGGFGQCLLTARFAPARGEEEALHRRLVGELLPSLPARKGLVCARLLRSLPLPPQTAEQKIRGRDDSADWIVLASGYDADAVASVAMPGAVTGLYRLAWSLSAADVLSGRK